LAHVRPQLGVELDRAQREALVASTRADSKAAWRGTILTKEALVEPSLERIDGRFDARRGNEPRRSEHFPQPAHAAIELGVGSDLDDDAAVLPLGAKAFEAAKRPSDAPLELLLEARAIPLLQDDLVVVDEDMRGLRQGPSRARLGWKLFLGHRHRLYLLSPARREAKELGARPSPPWLARLPRFLDVSERSPCRLRRRSGPPAGTRSGSNDGRIALRLGTAESSLDLSAYGQAGFGGAAGRRRGPRHELGRFPDRARVLARALEHRGSAYLPRPGSGAR